MPVSPARAAAFDILFRVAREQSYASELLHSSTYQTLSSKDHGLATELVMGVLRWQSALDHRIASASTTPLAKLDLEILIALRLAVYQFRWLDRVPQRAALNESVELVKRARKRSAAPFVNAVLRKLSAQPNPPDSSDNSNPQALAQNFAHPLWIVDRWAQAYGLAAAHQICAYDQSAPATTIRLRHPDAAANLTAEGITLAPGRLLRSAAVVNHGDVTSTQTFRSGKIAIQDEASQLVAALIGSGSNILDCCAAPGGKTSAIADRNPNAAITAIEVHPHRARLLRRLTSSSQHVRVVVADAMQLPTIRPFDRVLTDVPCSGTGTLARNPEIKWRLTPSDLNDLQARQVAILRSALAHLQPGGRLVYSTCSLEKEENEDVLQQALAGTRSFHILPCAEELALLRQSGELVFPDPASLTSGPFLRTIPGLHPCDGFFAAILQRD